MRKILLGIILLVCVGYAGAQADLPSAYRYIKVGNTLREAQQFSSAETYIKNGLSVVQAASGKDARYWEAVAYEYLGLLYRDQENSTESITALNKALNLYRTNGFGVSAGALGLLLGSVRETEDIYAGIDVGAKGVKLSIVSLKMGRNGEYSYKIIRKQTLNPQTSAGSDKAFSESAAAVRELVDTARGRSVSESRIFTVISSGLALALNKIDAGKVGQLQHLLAQDQAASRRPVEVITAQDEGRLVAKGVLPSRFLYNSMAVDIGSGNTKGGYYASDNRFESMSFDYGTVILTDAIKAVNTNNASYSDAAGAFFNDKLRPVIRTEMGRKPGFTNRRNVFMMGGCVWALVTYLYPQKVRESFVTFTLEDVRRLRKMATEHYDALVNPDLSSLDGDPSLKAAAEAEIKEIRDKVFNQENIIAGCLLIEGIMTEMNSSSPAKTYYFPRYGVVGWITGYVIESVEKGISVLHEN